MLHELARIDDNVIIGEGTKVWANVHICEGAQIGDNCVIGENVYIGKNVVIGNDCRIQNGALIYEGVLVGNNVFIGPNVVTTNDIYPELPVKDWKYRFKETIIEDKVSIGANATIVCGVILGQGCMIGAGSVVTKDVPCQSIVVGNPAKHLKWKNQN